MSPVAVAMDLLLAVLLVAAVMVGLRLNKRLKALRDGQAGFTAAVMELNQAAARAESGLAALRQASEEAHDQLLTRIDTARILAQKLEASAQRAEKLIAAADGLPSPPREAADGRVATSAAANGVLDNRVLDNSVLANIAAMVGAEPRIPGQAPTARFAPISVPRGDSGHARRDDASAAAARTAPAIIRRGRPTFDEDLFETGATDRVFDFDPLDRRAAAKS